MKNKMFKKYIFSSIFIICLLFGNTVYAESNNFNLTENPVKVQNKDENIIGEKYEFELVNEINLISDEKFEREELNLKAESILKHRKLKTKTNSSYEIALAYSDGNYSYLGSADSFEEAKEKALNYTIPYSEEIILPTVIDENGYVVYCTQSMGKVLKHVNSLPDTTFRYNTNIYKDSQLKSAFTYINHGYVEDVPIIEYNDKSAKIQISSYTGWINKNYKELDYDLLLIPINQVTNPSYYIVKDGMLYHFISSDLQSTTNKGTSLAIGVAPTYLKEGIKYLSYDGSYFYSAENIINGLQLVIEDLQNNNKNNAVNKDNPYYNYYNYLPFRSKSNYTASDLNNFIQANTKEDSLLRNTGQAFIDCQNSYGVNAILALGVAINESAWGRSSLAKQKNNLFGLGANDYIPENAEKFNTPSDSIIAFTQQFISRGYADPADWRYFGGILGNKNIGANVKYASDPFWGEKAASIAFYVDYYLSGKNINKLKDFNNYQLVMYKSDNITIDNLGNTLYKIYNSEGGYPGTVSVVINKSKNINGASYVEVLAERNTAVYDSNGNKVKYHGNYDWNFTANVLNKNLQFINSVKNEELSNFIQSVYIKALNREADFEGKNYWFNSLSNYRISGRYFLCNLLNEKEFIEKDFTADDYITIMYDIIVNRKPDEGGFKYWKNRYEKFREILPEKEARLEILYWMINESEFKGVCESLNILY